MLYFSTMHSTTGCWGGLRKQHGQCKGGISGGGGVEGEGGGVEGEGGGVEGRGGGGGRRGGGGGRGREEGWRGREGEGGGVEGEGGGVEGEGGGMERTGWRRGGEEGVEGEGWRSYYTSLKTTLRETKWPILASVLRHFYTPKPCIWILLQCKYLNKCTKKEKDKTALLH